MFPTKEIAVTRSAVKFTETVTETSQVRSPWRTALRTAFQALVSLAALAPFAVDAITDGSAAEQTGWVATYLAVSAAVTRLMAVPAVETFLRNYLPFLAAGAKS